jgi:hypothetical protein
VKVNKKLVALSIGVVILLLLGGIQTSFLYGTQFLSTKPGYTLSVAATSAWWDCNWSYAKKITIDHTKVQADETNFPVLLYEASDADLAAYSQENGNDIVFVDRWNVTQYHHELEKFDGDTGELWAWVNVTSLSSTRDTILYMYYGNPDCGSQHQVPGTWDAEFSMVHHLHEASGTHFDSTSYNNDGTPVGGVTQNVVGKIDGAVSLDGVDDYIDTGTSSSLNVTNQLTLEGWVKDPPVSLVREIPLAIADKHEEHRVIPLNGSFVVERTLTANDSSEVVFAALCSPGVTITDMTVDGVSVFAGSFTAGRPGCSAEQRVEDVRQQLSSRVRNLTGVAYSQSFRIRQGMATIRIICSSAPVGLRMSQGRMSYLVIGSGDRYDVECTTHWFSTQLVIAGLPMYPLARSEKDNTLDESPDVYHLCNGRIDYYISKTDPLQITNVYGQFWEHHVLCIDVDGREVCFNGSYAVRLENGSGYSSLVGVTTKSGFTLTITYTLKDDADEISLDPVITSNASYENTTVSWRITNISINGTHDDVLVVPEILRTALPINQTFEQKELVRYNLSSFNKTLSSNDLYENWIEFRDRAEETLTRTRWDLNTTYDFSLIPVEKPGDNDVFLEFATGPLSSGGPIVLSMRWVDMRVQDTGANITVDGTAYTANFGNAVATGDFNNDGKADALVGAYKDDVSYGKAYIFFGGSPTETCTESNANVTLQGTVTGGYFGYSVAMGDFNGDGKADALVGAYQNASGGTIRGCAKIFFGGAPYGKRLATAANVTFDGTVDSSYFGCSVAMGNFNGDSKADALVGAYQNTSGGQSRGCAKVFFGGSPYGRRLATAANVTFDGTVNNAYFGCSVAMGDFNGDSKADALIGAYSNGTAPGQTGCAKVFFGGTPYGRRLATAANVTFDGTVGKAYLGCAVAMGDFNGDSKADALVGAYGNTSGGSNRGCAKVFFGGSPIGRRLATDANATFDGTYDNSYLGYAVAMGDFNNDGKQDALVGAYNNNSMGGPGGAYGCAKLFFGGTPYGTRLASAANVTVDATAASSLGYSVAMGDFNGDGKSDALIGAYSDTSGEGNARVYFGGSPLGQRTDTSANVTFDGTIYTAYLGNAVAMDDFNGDGKVDALISAYQDDYYKGKVYIFFGGSPTGTRTESNANVTLQGTVSSGYFGYSVTTGDFNGDGKADALVGIYQNTSGGTARGCAKIFFGGTPYGTRLASTANVTFDGTVDSAALGYSVAMGDFNGDSKADALVGAYGNASGGTSRGCSKIFFGGTPYGTRLATAANVTIDGTVDLSYFGSSVAMGDFNGDSKADALVGAYLNASGGTSRGCAKIFFGGTPYGRRLATVANITFDGTVNSADFGYSAALGDFNGDGKQDALVGAIFNTSGGSNRGCAKIFYGGTPYGRRLATAANVTFDGTVNNEMLGCSVAIGNFNGDSKADALIGVQQNASGGTNRGCAKIFFGGPPTGRRLDTTANVTYDSTVNGALFGISVAMGDINNNGKKDVLVGASGDTSSEGKAYVFYDDTTIPSSSVNPPWPYWKSTSTFTITATASDTISGVRNVTLYYRYSSNNATWGGYVNTGLDTASPWSWSFTLSNGTGYYQFYTIAKDNSSNVEPAPASADAGAGYETSMPSSSVDALSPYWRNAAATITVTASDVGPSGIKNATLYYYNSSDNVTFYGPWRYDSKDNRTANWIYTIAGNGTAGYDGDNGLAFRREVQNPADIGADTNGVYIADYNNNRIRFIPKQSGTYYGQAMTVNYIYTIAGNGTAGYNGDNYLATMRRINKPTNVFPDANGFYISDFSNSRIRFVPKQTGTYYGQSMTANYIYTIAGNGTAGYNGDNYPATMRRLYQPGTAAVDSYGLYIADMYNHRVRFVPLQTGTYFGQSMTANYIYTIAGNGTAGYNGDNYLATMRRLYYPGSTHIDDYGVYIGDLYNYRIRFIPKQSGTYFGQSMTANYIYTIAGNGTAGYNGDNYLATMRRLYQPGTGPPDANGVYIADQLNHRIRFIPRQSGTYYGQSMTANFIYTIAGTGTAGYDGDNGLATSKKLSTPQGVWPDTDGFYIADANNNRIRFVPKYSGIRFNFTFPKGVGYYRFYSKAGDNAGNTESAPVVNDTICGYDTITPTSSVNIISPYWQKSSPLTITATASDSLSGVKNVTLYYRYSSNNDSWGGYVSAGVDTASPWSWSFSFSNGTGYYQFYSIAKDNLSNAESAPGGADSSCGYDTGNPSSSVNAVSSYWYKTSSLTITATASDALSGMKNVTLYYRFSNNNGSWDGWVSTGVDTVSPWSWSFTFTNGTGYYQFYSIARDNATNVESAPGSPDVLCGYDTNAPSSSANTISLYWQKTSPLTITATTSDALSGVKNVTLYYRFSSNNGSWDGLVSCGVDTASPWSWSFSFTNGTGYYQFYSIAKDNATNVESTPGSADTNCGYDTIAPSSSVDAISPYWKNISTMITGTASDTTSGVKNVTLYYRFSSNNASWGAYVSTGVDTSSPWNWSFSFTNGTGYYQFYSIATDNATNTENAPGFTDMTCGYDATAPSSTVDTITPYWKSTATTITATASDTTSGVKNVTLYYRFSSNNGSWGVWVSGSVDTASPWSWSFTFANGSGYYQFYSIAKDNATNTESAPGTADTQSGYDTTAPTSSVDAISYYWRKTIPITINATASDDLSGVKNASLWYRFSSNNASWGGWVDPPQPRNFSWSFNFTNGTGYYQFYSIAIDNATNTESAPGSADAIYGYDNIAPSSSVDTFSTYWKNAATTITATVNDATSGVKNITLYYRFSSDNGSWSGWVDADVDIASPWSWSFPYTNGTGYYQFYSIATDNATNAESAPSSADALNGYETTAPSSSIDAITPYWKKATTTITAIASDTTSGVKNVTLYYRFSGDNASWGSYVSAGVDTASPWSWSFTFPNGTGYYQFYSIAKDNATNTESAPGSADALCGNDNVAPDSSVDTISPYWKTSSPVAVSATATDALSGVKNVTLYYRYSSSNASWGTYVSAGIDTASPWSWSFSFTNGTGYYQFLSIATDNATNTESAPGSADALCGYDTTSPNSSVTVIAPYWKTATTTITATASDAMSGVKNVTLYYRFSSNNASWGGYTSYSVDTASPWSWSFTFPNGTGYYQFYSIAKDNATIIESAPGSADTTAGYDPSAPSSAVSTITPYWKTSQPQTLTGTASDTGVSGLKNVTLWWRFSSNNASWDGWTNGTYSFFDSDPWVSVYWIFTFPNGTGYYQFYSRARDNASNIEGVPGTADAMAGYDVAAPSSSVNAITPYWKGTSPTTITATASDGASGVKNVTLYYRFSNSNVSWGSYVSAGVDTASPWSWSMAFSNGSGFYQFYSIAKDNATNSESAPVSADTWCGYDNFVPSSNVNTISPYWKASSPQTLTGTASDTLGERYNIGDDGGFPGGGNLWKCQTFTVGNSGNNVSHYIKSVKLKLYRTGSPGTMIVGIRATNVTGYPIGNDLTNGTIDGNTLTTDSGGLWYQINFTTPYALSQGTKYAIVVRAPNAAVNNQFTWRFDSTSPTYSGGSYINGQNSGTTWSINVGLDLMFEENSVPLSGLKNVTLWYRYRATNSSSWGRWVTSGLVDIDPWVAVSWSFTFPNGTGHYQFYSIAKDNATNTESAPGSADAIGGYDNVAPTSSVTAISPYWKTAAATVIATASDALSGVKNVTLYYSYSNNNLSFGHYVSFGVDVAAPWSWSFAFSNGTGYYQFYSIAKDNATNVESPPARPPDAFCGYDNVAPSSSVNAITPYWKKSSPLTITATASDATSGVKNVTLYYRFSTNNVTFGGWVSGGVDTASPWSWSFNFPNGTGRYQVYSIAKDYATNVESAPTGLNPYDQIFGYDNVAPTSSVNSISPYWKTASPTTITATASDAMSGVKNVTLYYRYSGDNLSWGGWTHTDAQWAKGPTGPGSDWGRAIAVDTSGNIYITGYQTSGLNFGGGITVADEAGVGIFVAKYNSAGVLQWATGPTGAGDDYGRGIGVDSSGNVYVSGYQTSGLDFGGGITVADEGGTGMFVAKYNSAGVVQWATGPSGAGNDQGRAMAVDSSGNSYITGYDTSGLDFGGGITVADEAGVGMFVAKYNSVGVVQWATGPTGAGDDYGYGTAADSSGNVYVTGYHTSGLNFGGGVTVGDETADGLFTVKYNSAGAVQWATGPTGTGNEHGQDVVVDSSGNVYVVGYHTLGMNFGGGITLADEGSDGVFVVKYDSGGVAQWAAGPVGAGQDEGYGIALDSSNSVYLTGYQESGLNFSSGVTVADEGSWGAFVAKYSTAGVIQWGVGSTGSGDDVGLDVVVDSSNNFYVVGYQTTGLSFAFGISVADEGTDGIFVVKYNGAVIDPASPWSWSFAFNNGTGYYQFYSIAKDNATNTESAPGGPGGDPFDTKCGYDNIAPSSTTDAISPYWKTTSPLTITTTASDTGPSGLKNVTMYYRFSTNNASWGGYVSAGVDTASPWSWSFSFSNGTGYYQFYSIAKDNATNAEAAPGTADAKCGYDNVPPSSSVNAISPYWQKTSPLTITATASDALSGVKNVTLWYRYRATNASGWGGWVNSGLVDTDPWVAVSWSFMFPNGTGHYQFYSIAKDNTSNDESAPGSADAQCGNDNLAPTSSVNSIVPYVRMNSSVTITATASDNGPSGLKNITLKYRYSPNNSSWGAWTSFGIHTTPWSGISWSFPFSNGTGYYEYYSIATDNATNQEAAPGSADARCRYLPIANPTVITNASTGVEETNATLRGYLQNDGGESCTVRFQYGTTTNYGTNTTNQIKSTGSTFQQDITALTPGHLYHFRAYANNTAGNSTGNDATFLTKPNPPTSLTAQTNTSTKAYLTWVKGTGANTTRIQRTTGGYPTSVNDGITVYNLSGTQTEDTGLVPGTTYYYRAWSYSAWNTLSQWSDTYASATTTTKNVPILSNENPLNGSTGIILNTTLSIQVNHNNGYQMNITWYWGTTSDCPNFIGRNTSVVNGTYSMGNDGNFSSNSQTYYWRVTVNDGHGEWTNATYHFSSIPPNKRIISKGRGAYALEMSPGGTILYGYINGVSVQTTIDTSWHYVTLTYDGNSIKLYEDGKLRNSTGLSGSINVNAFDLLLGEYLSGKLDEVRVSSTARSAAWINTTYLDTNSPATFATFGDQVGVLSTWTYRKKVTINHAFVTSTLTNFPVLVCNASDMNLMGHAQSTGNDILFMGAAEDWTTGTWRDKLDFEIEKYDHSTGELETWVRIPTLSASADTELYMYYGNVLCNISRQNPTGVWDSNYCGVWHLKETGSGAAGEYLDSTVKDNDGRGGDGNSNRVPAFTSSGRVDGANVFDGVDDSIDVSGRSSLNITGSLTLEAWVHPDVVSSHRCLVRFSSNDSSPGKGYLMELQGGQLHALVGLKGGSTSEILAGSIPSSAWSYAAVTWNTSVLKGFINGNLAVNSSPNAHDIESPNSLFRLGSSTSNMSFFDGILDEVRISSTTRSVGWINASYATINRTSGFLSFGRQLVKDVAPTQGNPSPESGATNVTINPALAITISGINTDSMNVSFRTNSTGTWTTIGTNASVLNGTYRQTTTTMNHLSTTYYWSTNISDGMMWTNETYWFTTASAMTAYATADDGWIQNTSAVYNTAQGAENGTVFSSSSTFMVGQDPSYRIARGFVFFNTSNIPDDATITSATFRLYGASDASDTDFAVLVYSGQPSHPHIPLVPQDFDAENYSVNASPGMLLTSSFSLDEYANLSLYPSTINKTGITKLLLWSSLDKNAIVPTPAMNEYVTFYTSEQGSGYKPGLVIIYT